MFRELVEEVSGQLVPGSQSGAALSLRFSFYQPSHRHRYTHKHTDRQTSKQKTPALRVKAASSINTHTHNLFSSLVLGCHALLIPSTFRHGERKKNSIKCGLYEDARIIFLLHKVISAGVNPRGDLGSVHFT